MGDVASGRWCYRVESGGVGTWSDEDDDATPGNPGTGHWHRHRRWRWALAGRYSDLAARRPPQRSAAHCSQDKRSVFRLTACQRGLQLLTDRQARGFACENRGPVRAGDAARARSLEGRMCAGGWMRKLRVREWRLRRRLGGPSSFSAGFGALLRPDQTFIQTTQYLPSLHSSTMKKPVTLAPPPSYRLAVAL